MVDLKRLTHEAMLILTIFARHVDISIGKMIEMSETSLGYVQGRMFTWLLTLGRKGHAQRIIRLSLKK